VTIITPMSVIDLNFTKINSFKAVIAVYISLSDIGLVSTINLSRVVDKCASTFRLVLLHRGIGIGCWVLWS